jgi:hypothetical protein
MKGLITSIVMLLVISGGVGAESPRQVKGTRVVVTPPPGFEVADRFPGFMSEETGASVMVTELAGPFSEVAKGFNASGLRKQGMTLLSQDAAQYGTYLGVLISAAQSAHGVDYLKWMAAFGDDKTTYLVTATFPKKAEANLSDVLKKTVMGVRVGVTDVDPFDALTFRISPTNEMKLAKVMANSILLSKGGVFPAKRVEIPIFIVGASASKGLTIPDKSAFAEARLKRVALLKEVRLTATEPVTIGGLDGVESIADALDADSAAKMLLYQVVLFDTDGYYLMQGIASDREGKAQLPTFKEIARSFRKSQAQRQNSARPGR